MIDIQCGDCMSMTVVLAATDLTFEQGIERKANANLISAAPDMYRALRELLSRIENDKDVRHWFIDEQALAIKALAKADGEQDDE